ncbi:MAG: hypothetical protein RR618_04020 [Cellulosilyticaceae bacterium]
MKIATYNCRWNKFLKLDGIAGKPCAIGEGDALVEEVLNVARELGFEWLIVENDNPMPNGLEDITRSIKNIQDRYQIEGEI